MPSRPCSPAQTIGRSRHVVTTVYCWDMPSVHAALPRPNQARVQSQGSAAHVLPPQLVPVQSEGKALRVCPYPPCLGAAAQVLPTQLVSDEKAGEVLRVCPKPWCLAAQVLPTQLIPDEKEGKVLRVRMIQKEGVKFFNPAYLFDEGSTISWIPCGRKLTCSFPGIKFYYGPDTYFGEEVCPLILSAPGSML